MRWLEVISLVLPLAVLGAGLPACENEQPKTALGYTALSFAHGAAGSTIDTIERDPEHVELARKNIATAGFAERITVHDGDFAAVLPTIRGLLVNDLRAAYVGDPAAQGFPEIILGYPGMTAILHYRLAHALHERGAPLLARLISEIAHSKTGIDIHPGAEIGGSFFIDHGTGVVIGATAIIGERVRLYQAVTLGAKRFPVGENGALVKGNARHPIIEDDVVIYAGATILGRVTIGRGSTIGGNVWITRDVPPNSSVSQALARGDAFDEGGGI